MSEVISSDVQQFWGGLGGLRGGAGARGWGVLLGVFEQENEGDHEQEDEAHDFEGLDEGEHGGLLLDLEQQGSVSPARGGYRVGALEDEEAGELVKRGPGVGLAGTDLFDEAALVELLAARKQGGHDGDADAAADVAHQVEDAGGVAHLLAGDVRHGGGRERNEETGHGSALDDLGPEDVPIASVQVEAGEHEHGACSDEKSGDEQLAHVYVGGNRTDDKGESKGTETAWGERESGLEGGVVEEGFEILRQEHETGVKAEADGRHNQHADGKGAVLEGAQVDDRDVRW